MEQIDILLHMAILVFFSMACIYIGWRFLQSVGNPDIIKFSGIFLTCYASMYILTVMQLWLGLHEPTTAMLGLIVVVGLIFVILWILMNSGWIRTKVYGLFHVPVFGGKTT